MSPSRRLLVAGALVAGLAAATVPSHAGPSKAVAARSELAGYGGADLFRGLVLGTGPVAAHFPEVNRPTSGAMAEVQERLVAAIDRTQPGYFDSFAATMRSGDRLAVEDELIRTVAMLANAARDEIQKAQGGMALPPEVEHQLITLIRTVDPAVQQGAQPANRAVAQAGNTTEALIGKVGVATRSSVFAYSESIAAIITKVYVVGWPFKQAPGEVPGGEGVALDMYVDHIVTVL